MADKLLPCPFCGGEVELVKQKSDEFEFLLVSCKNCDATIGIGDSDNEQKVSEAWNNRPTPWHIFNDWSNAPDCDDVLVTIENRFGQRFVTEAWWSVDCDGRCQWHTNGIKYAEDWEAGDFHLSHNWKVVAWRYRLEPYKED